MNQKLGGEIIFGSIVIPPSQVFLSRKNVFAMVNHKPFLPGHVLVCSKKSVGKLSELTQIEILDLFLSAQQISNKLSTLNQCLYQVSVQNGKDSGQTVPHVHLHLCPQASKEQQKRKENTETRTEEDMASQASKYRTCFQQSNNQ